MHEDDMYAVIANSLMLVVWPGEGGTSWLSLPPPSPL